MADQPSSDERYFWKSYELNKTQYEAIRSIGTRDTFIETDAHKRSEDFIRRAWE